MVAPINVLAFTRRFYQWETSSVPKALEHLNMRSDTVKTIMRKFVKDKQFVFRLKQNCFNVLCTHVHTVAATGI